MANQQTNSDYEIGWLVGLLDGEGWFILAKAWRWQRKSNIYVPTCGFGITSEEIVKEAHRILNKLGVGHWIGKRNMSNPRWSDQWTLVIRGLRRCEQLLPLIKDRLIEKNKQANLLFDFIQYRKKLNNWDTYSEVEEKFYQESKRLNVKGKVSTTKG